MTDFGSIHTNDTYKGGIFPVFLACNIKLYNCYFGNVVIRGAHGVFISFHAGTRII